MADSSPFSPRGLALFTTTTIFLSLDAISLILRFAAMRISRRKFFIDDFHILFAFANAVALGGVAIWTCFQGIGKSVTELNPHQIAATAKLLFTAYICWLLSSVFYKLAILSLYNRIFTTKTFKIWSYTITGITAAYCISYFCVYMTNCIPLDHLWNPTPNRHCRSGQVSDYSTLAINLVLDIAILVLPLPSLWSLQLPTRKKAVVTIMLSFGILTIAVMIWRAVWTHEYRNNSDITSYAPFIAIVACLELWIGILVANIPTLAPLFRGSRFAIDSGYRGRTDGSGSRTISPKTTYKSKKKQYDEISLVNDGLDIELQTASKQDAHIRTGNSMVMADCSYDPTHNGGPERFKPNSIHVHTNII